MTRSGSTARIVLAVGAKPFDMGRSEVDGNWHVGLSMLFLSEADYRAYDADSDHNGLRARWTTRCRLIRIHDLDER